MIGNKQGQASATTAFVTMLEANHQVDEHGDSVPSPEPFAAIITHQGGRILELECPRPILNDCALKIESEDAIWLGSAESCKAAVAEIPDSSCECTWHVTVQVTRVLRDMETLKRLARLFGSPSVNNPNLFRKTVRV